jgi:hypothetical protein
MPLAGGGALQANFEIQLLRGFFVPRLGFGHGGITEQLVGRFLGHDL